MVGSKWSPKFNYAIRPCKLYFAWLGILLLLMLAMPFLGTIFLQVDGFILCATAFLSTSSLLQPQKKIFDVLEVIVNVM